MCMRAILWIIFITGEKENWIVCLCLVSPVLQSGSVSWRLLKASAHGEHRLPRGELSGSYGRCDLQASRLREKMMTSENLIHYSLEILRNVVRVLQMTLEKYQPCLPRVPSLRFN